VVSSVFWCFYGDLVARVFWVVSSVIWVVDRVFWVVFRVFW